MDLFMASTRRERYIKWVDGYAYYFRRVPKDLLEYYGKNFIKEALGTKDIAVAGSRRDAVNSATEEFWNRYRLTGGDELAIDRYERAVLASKQLGFSYKSLKELLSASDDEISQRVTAVMQHKEGALQEQAAEALLGVVEEPEVILSVALERYWEWTEDRRTGKNETQIRVWKHVRTRAVRNFIEVAGDKPIEEYSRQDVISYRSWWMARVVAGKVKAETANKDMDILSNVFQTTFDMLAIKRDNPFHKIRLKKDDSEARKSLTPKQTLDSIFAKGQLQSMNAECRAVVHICAETGARPSEVFTRAPEDICLNHPVPHVKIRKNEFGKLKTTVSRRNIPLTGAALRAFEQFPNGFPRYQRNTASGVTAINKYFRENRVLPEGATLYSLRHGFQDRLTALGPPERVQADLMGHALSRPRYGEGLPLKEMRDWLVQIVLVP